MNQAASTRNAITFVLLFTFASRETFPSRVLLSQRFLSLVNEVIVKMFQLAPAEDRAAVFLLSRSHQVSLLHDKSSGDCVKEKLRNK